MYFSSRYRVYLVSKRSNEGIDSASVIDLRFFVRFRESIVLRNAKNNNNCDKELIFMGLLGIQYSTLSCGKWLHIYLQLYFDGITYKYCAGISRSRQQNAELEPFRGCYLFVNFFFFPFNLVSNKAFFFLTFLHY